VGRVQSRVATLFGVASLLVGCSHRVDLKKVPLVETTTKIVALDGSFTLTPGKPVAVPFNSICPKTPDTGKSGWGGWNVTPGAKAVRVYVPGMDPFFGLLAFCPVWSDYDGPAASSYLIKVSDDYVNQTDQDREVAVFETYEGAGGQMLPAWILWFAKKKTLINVYDLGAASRAASAISLPEEYFLVGDPR